LPLSFNLNCQATLDSCLRCKFSFVENVLDVKADVSRLAGTIGALNEAGDGRND
jgi:hypothetical protein